MFSGGGDTVLLIELAEQLLEECAHGVVVDARQAHIAVLVEDGVDAKVDAVVGKLLDDGAETACVGEVVHLLLELELLDDVLHVVAEAIEILQEVLFQPHGIDLAAQRLHGEARRVAEGIARDGIQLYLLCTLGYSELCQHFLLLEHPFVCRLKEDVETA